MISLSGALPRTTRLPAGNGADDGAGWRSLPDGMTLGGGMEKAAVDAPDGTRDEGGQEVRHGDHSARTPAEGLVAGKSGEGDVGKWSVAP
jgi:hypothetical protein